MSYEEERMHILDLIDSGKISAEEGLFLLKALAADKEQPPSEEMLEPSSPSSEAGVTVAESEFAETTPTEGFPEAVQAPQRAAEIGFEGKPFDEESHETPPYVKKWANWWTIPLWIGVGITIVGGFLMYRALETSGLNFWFACASVPFLLGLVVMILAFESRTAPWLHLRVDQKPGERPERIALSFPIPIRPTAWFLRTFGHRIRGLKDSSLDEVILALGQTTSPERPLYIQVDDEEDGEKVEIYIG